MAEKEFATKDDVQSSMLWILNAQVNALRARRDRARGFCMNQAMQIEADLCQAQIDVLKEYLEEAKI